MTLLIHFPSAQNDGEAKTQWALSQDFSYWEEQVAAASCRRVELRQRIGAALLNSAARCRRYFSHFFWVTTC